MYNKIVYLSGRHVSTLQGHHQAVQEDRSKSYVMFHCIVVSQMLTSYKTCKHLGSHNAVKHNTTLGSAFLKGLMMTL